MRPREARRPLMSITRRVLPSGRVSWRVKVSWGQRAIAQKSFSRLGDAKRWEAHRVSNLRLGGWIDPRRGRVSFGEVAERWQASRDHVAVRSQETTRYLLDRDITAGQ